MRRAPIKPLPPRALLAALLDYDPLTGTLVWRRKTSGERSAICFNNRCGGKPAGTVTERGYVAIGIRVGEKLVYYLAQRIIWKLMTGNDPGELVDHEDGDRINNRWCNLRPATNGQNIQNSKLRRDNTSGVKGVCWDAERSKWRATITVNGRVMKVGRFDTIASAEQAMTEARERHHGAFARTA